MKKGFTLIELLAVIVILAIILAIAIPAITGVINNSTENAFESDAKLVLKQLQYEKLEDDNFDETTVTETNITDYNLDDSNYQSLDVGLVSGKPYIIIVGKNKWANLKACGTIQNMKVVASSDTTTCSDISGAYSVTEGVNKPQLATGMTPIKWNGTSWEETTASDSDWYSYDTTNKKWANAITEDGSYWVWIPRYAYQIAANYHTSTTGTINIKFLQGTTLTASDDSTVATTPTYSGSVQTNYIEEPAFNFGGTELTGIWAAKFEASNDGSNNVKIIPNVTPWRSIKIGDAFDKARSMETTSVYGWGTTGTAIDTHLIKNTEWASISYLTQSAYGANAEIWINPNSNRTTGCAGDSASAAGTTSCNTYNSANGVKASTTGNIYGVYDMSGGVWEYISAYVNNADASLSNGTTVINSSAQYKDVYTVGSPDTSANNYAQAADKKGDAVYEVSSAGTGTAWYSDTSNTPSANMPWFIRGGCYGDDTDAGVFDYSYFSGGAHLDVGFRPILIVNEGI